MNSQHLALVALCLSLLVSAPALADAPPGYYDSVDLSSQASLRATLHGVIDDHTRYPYSSSSTDTWDILELADEDPNNSSRILDVYKNSSIAKFGGGSGPYNREHSWPRSYGFPSSGDIPYTDCHHLFLCDVAYNSDRGNKPFDDTTGSERVTLVNDGQGGGSGVYPGNSNWFSSTRWQTWSGRQGDVARALLYMDVRYEGGTHGTLGWSEPDLILTDDAGQIVTSSGPVAYMGLLSVLRAWHFADPVDQKERDRNDVVFSFQGNRNPFIDHPEWVEALYGETTATPLIPMPLAITNVYPNPMNPLSRMSFVLNTPGQTRVDVYSVDGRLVRTLLDAPRPAGAFEVLWDGTDQAGSGAASGTYVFRLMSGSASDARKVVLIK